MKKQTLSVIALMLIVGTGNVYGQMKEWNWAKYSTSFECPVSMKLISNDSTKFAASNDSIYLAIYPKMDEYFYEDEMQEAVQNWAEESEVTIETGPVALIDTIYTEYDGAFISGYKQGSQVILAYMNDPDYIEISFYVWISFKPGLARKAFDILESFYPD